ncbi:MAG: CpsD/CapB family tyrosine-protein kinase [Firmicutes bacterium]|nr:CpsD/CapB family tyrosine-protein kinase [Bacillota bacterium]
MKSELIVKDNPKSNVAETLRIVRTNLLFSAVDESMKTILVTSSLPGEGKSFISSNLALTFALNSHKILLVDCDMRKGRLHKIFNVENDKGFSDLLIDDINVDVKKYIKKTEFDNLSIITMGTVPPNPAELLSSARCKVIVSMLKNKFDYIIFDGTPVNGLTDSIIMASIVDKVAIVSSVGSTKIDALKSCKQSLDNVEANIAGVIANKIQSDKNSYYSYYTEN